jgi:glycosyltransferase involved in cell wall biosynthesis
MLGKGWFPEQLGGLDRYYRDLLEHLPEARGLIVGPAPDSPQRLTAVSSHDAPLAKRLIALWRAAGKAGRDAVVIDAHFALYALLPMLSKRLRSLPTVVHFQGPWADENVAAGDSSPVRHRLRRGLERLVYRRADRVIVLTSAFRRVLVENYGVSPWRVHVVPPGVDLDRFSPGHRGAARERFGLDADAFAVVSVRRLVPRMGLDVLLDAWAQTLAELPQGAQLLVAGDGPERAALETQVERLGLSESVRLLGCISDEDLLELYRAADLGVVPTRAFEGFGLVVIEAAACGTPTIVTDIGGLPEAVHALDASLTVAPDDVEALAERMAAATRPGGLPSREETRRFAECFSWSTAVQRNRDVMHEAMGPDAVQRRMRVVYLDHVAQISGGEIALLRLLPHLDEVDAHVILAEHGPFADRLVQAGVSVEVLRMGESARSLRKHSITTRALPASAVFHTAAYIWRVALRLRQLRPDLVHTNSLKAGVYGSLAGRIAGVPVVWHVHDRISADYLPSVGVRLVRYMLPLASSVVANSQATLATLGHRRSADNFHVIPNVLPEFSVVPSRDASPRCVFGIVGRIAPWKGQDLFLQGFALAFPTGNEKAVIIGAPLFGDDSFEADLRQLAADLGISERVIFRGFREDVWTELAQLDVLVHASTTPEPFGQVVVEGMAAGLAVVAADEGGPAEILRDTGAGRLFRARDVSSLAEVLIELREAPALRIQLGAAAGKALKPFQAEPVAAAMYRVYATVSARARLAGG